MTTTEREAVAPDLVLVHDLDAEGAPEATRCAACEGTGMVQCDACLLADSVCDACGERAEVLIDGTLPLCHACNAEAA